jgi:hypothetical protein
MTGQKMQDLAKVLFWGAAILALVMAIPSSAASFINGIDDTVQHSLAFSALALLASLAYPSARLLTILFGLSLFGGVIELLQILPGIEREAEWGDWLVDICAAGITLGVVVLARRLRTSAFS